MMAHRGSSPRGPFALAALASMALAACAETPPPRAPSSDAIAFVGVSVVPLDTERVLPNHTVVIRGGRIVAMGPSADTEAPPGARRIEGRGRFLMPGLTDAHAHLIREEDLRLFLARGVTTVRNMWGAPRHVAWREAIRRGDIAGPAIYTAGPIVDGERPVHDGSVAMREASEAEAVIALHAAGGYDFVKVYSRLSAPAFRALVKAARERGLPVAGHVPREVGLAAVIDAGVSSIEHLNSFDDALQSASSPVAGKWDGASREAKIDYIDAAKIPVLTAMLRDRGAFFCPTRNLLSQVAPPDAVKARLARPEMRYVPGYERAIWTSEGAPPAEGRARLDRTIALGDTLVRAIHEGGGRLVAGTDTGNPMVIPGFTLHEELELFVAAGLSPYHALRAATVGPAELMQRERETGTVAVGKRADLLLIEGNPLVDVKAADRIVGVMANGRYYDEGARTAMLADVEAWAQGKKDPFAGVPPLTGSGTKELEATYLLTWNGVPFDHERVLVERLAGGERVIRAQTIDPHKGQWTAMHLATGARGVGRWLRVESDGAAGRGAIEVNREGSKVVWRGTLLSGLPVDRGESFPEGGMLGVDHFIASKILLSEGLAKLDVGQALSVHEGAIALGSRVEVKGGAKVTTRTPDTTVILGGARVAARRYEIAREKGKPDVLLLDEGGFPLALELTAWGIKLERIGG